MRLQTIEKSILTSKIIPSATITHPNSNDNPKNSLNSSEECCVICELLLSIYQNHQLDWNLQTHTYTQIKGTYEGTYENNNTKGTNFHTSHMKREQQHHLKVNKRHLRRNYRTKQKHPNHKRPTTQKVARKWNKEWKKRDSRRWTPREESHKGKWQKGNQQKLKTERGSGGESETKREFWEKSFNF